MTKTGDMFIVSLEDNHVMSGELFMIIGSSGDHFVFVVGNSKRIKK